MCANVYSGHLAASSGIYLVGSTFFSLSMIREEYLRAVRLLFFFAANGRHS